MANPNAIFILESIEITVQCLKTETMRTIIQRFGVKAQKSDDSFIKWAIAFLVHNYSNKALFVAFVYNLVYNIITT